jgi:hypothetical protein
MPKIRRISQIKAIRAIAHAMPLRAISRASIRKETQINPRCKRVPKMISKSHGGGPGGGGRAALMKRQAQPNLMPQTMLKAVLIRRHNLANRLYQTQQKTPLIPVMTSPGAGGACAENRQAVKRPPYRLMRIRHRPYCLRHKALMAKVLLSRLVRRQMTRP